MLIVYGLRRDFDGARGRAIMFIYSTLSSTLAFLFIVIIQIYLMKKDRDFASAHPSFA
jgi:hypothetical protein